MKNKNKDLGYIWMQFENYSFDEYVNVIMQPNGKFNSLKEGARVFENIKWH